MTARSSPLTAHLRCSRAGRGRRRRAGPLGASATPRSSATTPPSTNPFTSSNRNPDGVRRPKNSGCFDDFFGHGGAAPLRFEGDGVSPGDGQTPLQREAADEQPTTSARTRRALAGPADPDPLLVLIPLTAPSKAYAQVPPNPAPEAPPGASFLGQVLGWLKCGRPVGGGGRPVDRRDRRRRRPLRFELRGGVSGPQVDARRHGRGGVVRSGLDDGEHDLHLDVADMRWGLIVGAGSAGRRQCWASAGPWSVTSWPATTRRRRVTRPWRGWRGAPGPGSGSGVVAATPESDPDDADPSSTLQPPAAPATAFGER